MTREETGKLLAVITYTYPNFKMDNPEMAAETWWKILEPYDGQNIMDAFVVYARTNTSGFAPTPGKLISMVADRENPGMTEGEITDMLTRAARNGNYNSEEEFKKLPPLLQKAVGSPTVIRNWGSLEKDNLSYAFCAINKVYRELLKREKENTAAAGSTLYKEPQIEQAPAPMIEDKQEPKAKATGWTEERQEKLNALYERLKANGQNTDDELT